MVQMERESFAVPLPSVAMDFVSTKARVALRNAIMVWFLVDRCAYPVMQTANVALDPLATAFFVLPRANVAMDSVFPRACLVLKDALQALSGVEGHALLATTAASAALAHLAKEACVGLPRYAAITGSVLLKAPVAK